jgi:hypothetical protein
MALGSVAVTRSQSGFARFTAPQIISDPSYLSPNWILFPKGMDLQPVTKSKFSGFQTVLCHGDFDAQYVAQLAPKDVRIARVGYPRYDGYHIGTRINSPAAVHRTVHDKQQLKVLMLPTTVGNRTDFSLRFLKQIQLLEPLFHYAEVTIRPHPEEKSKYSGAVARRIKLLGGSVENDAMADFGALIRNTDLVVCDYGGAVFSALYLRKPVLLLRGFSPKKESNVILDLRNQLLSVSVAQSTRDRILINFAGRAFSSTFAELLRNDELWARSIAAQELIRAHVFGDIDGFGSHRMAMFLSRLASGCSLDEALRASGMKRYQ